MHRILIVDDERHIVNSLSELFSSIPDLDLDIYRAYSGDEALAILAQTNIDIVLSDYRMPGMNGLELLDRVKANWADRRVIILSGYNEFEYVYQASSHGAVRFILKTEDDDVIVAAVLDAVDSIEKGRTESAMVDKSRFAEGLLDWMDRSDALRLSIESRTENPAPLFDPSLPALPVFGYPLLVLAGKTKSELMKTWYSLDIMSGKCFSAYARCAVLEIASEGALWILQELPRANRNWAALPPIPFLCQLFEELQSRAASSLGLAMGFVIQDFPVAWRDLAKAVESLEVRAAGLAKNAPEGSESITFAPAGTAMEGAGDKALEGKIRRFIEGNLSGDLTLTNISRSVFYNPSYISRVFKRATGTNLTDYISRKRVDMAAQLLSGSERNISDIARDCGFDSPQYFSTVFRKAMGLAPLSFRENERKKRQEF